VKRSVFPVVLCFLLIVSSLGAEDAAVAARPLAGRTMVIIPFENASPTPGLEWLSESFPEALYPQLTSPLLFVASRDERLRAYDRQGIPAAVHASRATLYRLAEQMDVDYAVLGSYQYDGSRLTVRAQLLDMRGQRLSTAVVESAPLSDLATLQSRLAWDLLRLIRSDFAVAKDKYVAGVAPARLDALENYVRGILAATLDERAQRYREAVRLKPDYDQAWLELGKTYYEQHNFEAAITALGQVQHSSDGAREASFYLGLAAYSIGDLARAENAFQFVAGRLPLAEVYNDLGVVAGERGQKKATDYFEKAIQNDPSDADYHFNLGAALLQFGDRAGAARELRKALEERPNDTEAKSVLDSVLPPAGTIVAASAVVKAPAGRLKRTYEEDAFRQMTTQMAGWAEERFSRSDAHTHAHFHVELGHELLAHGFTREAEAEFRHAAAVDPTSSGPLIGLAEDYDAQGNLPAARAEAEAALRLRESADNYVVLARIQWEENNVDAATQNVERALQLEPNSVSGQEMKRRLAAKSTTKGQADQP
jgi:tetratricopeptide (TPR) repeat protein